MLRKVAKRKTGKLPAGKEKLRRDSAKRDRERARREYAETWGCQYTSEYLSRWRDPCPLCGLWRPPFRRHHVTRRARGGKAEDIAMVCYKCDALIHGPRPASAPPIDEEKILRPIADALANAGRALGYLPLEQCAKCRQWYSVRYMVDEIHRGKPTRRVCTKRCCKDVLP